MVKAESSRLANNCTNITNIIIIHIASTTTIRLRALAGFLAGVQASHFFKPGGSRNVIGVTFIIFDGPGQLQMQTQA